MQRRWRPLSAAALAALLLALGGHAYATSCYIPTEIADLELVGVTEDGAPAADLSAYGQVQVTLFPGGLRYQFTPREGEQARFYESEVYYEER